jgi:hypothetical protein
MANTSSAVDWTSASKFGTFTATKGTRKPSSSSGRLKPFGTYGGDPLAGRLSLLGQVSGNVRKSQHHTTKMIRESISGIFEGSICLFVSSRGIETQPLIFCGQTKISSGLWVMKDGLHKQMCLLHPWSTIAFHLGLWHGFLEESMLLLLKILT